MINGWLKTCWKDHNCGPTSDTRLPTRVLELGTKETPILHLSISAGRKGRYVALSHCWGKRPTTTTTTRNIDDHLKAIDLNALPANFRDAVLISRELGYEYLWIDSLCIIQGDRDDWVTESSLMGQVYQNCAVMLAASGASDSYGGMLNLRQESCALPNSSLFLSPKLKPIQTLEESELGSRAWASQERILAPRIIYYAAEQIFWECRDDRRAESTIQMLRDTYQSYNKRYHDRLRTDYSNAYNYTEYLNSKAATTTEDEESSDDDEMTIRPEGWFWAIQGYSRRHLTNPTDKLPALSGLAQNVFHPRRATGGHYLAGLWSNDIVRQLLWENGEDRVPIFCEANYIAVSSLRTITKLSKAAKYRGPSWSWVAYDGPIYPNRRDDSIIPELDVDMDEARKKHLERSKRWNLKLLEMNMRFASKDPFGQLVEGSNIVVEGACQFVDFRPGHKTIFPDSEVECHCDFDVREMGSVEGKYLCLQVGRRHGRVSPEFHKDPESLANDRLDQLGVRALLLKKVANEQEELWERVGLGIFDIDGETDGRWGPRILSLI